MIKVRSTHTYEGIQNEEGGKVIKNRSRKGSKHQKNIPDLGSYIADNNDQSFGSCPDILNQLRHFGLETVETEENEVKVNHNGVNKKLQLHHAHSNQTDNFLDFSKLAKDIDISHQLKSNRFKESLLNKIAVVHQKSNEIRKQAKIIKESVEEQTKRLILYLMQVVNDINGEVVRKTQSFIRQSDRLRDQNTALGFQMAEIKRQNIQLQSILRRSQRQNHKVSESTTNKGLNDASKELQAIKKKFQNLNDPTVQEPPQEQEFQMDIEQLKDKNRDMENKIKNLEIFIKEKDEEFSKKEESTKEKYMGIIKKFGQEVDIIEGEFLEIKSERESLNMELSEREEKIYQKERFLQESLAGLNKRSQKLSMREEIVKQREQTVSQQNEDNFGDSQSPTLFHRFAEHQEISPPPRKQYFSPRSLISPDRQFRLKNIQGKSYLHTPQHRFEQRAKPHIRGFQAQDLSQRINKVQYSLKHDLNTIFK